jgi:hypothetical protein
MKPKIRAPARAARPLLPRGGIETRSATPWRRAYQLRVPGREIRPGDADLSNETCSLFSMYLRPDQELPGQPLVSRRAITMRGVRRVKRPPCDETSALTCRSRGFS